VDRTGRLPYLGAYWQLVTYRTQAGGHCGQKHLPRLPQWLLLVGEGSPLDQPVPQEIFYGNGLSGLTT